MLEIKNGIITKFEIENIKFVKEIIPISHTLARPQTPMTAGLITVHNFGNDTPAKNVSNYVNTQNGYKSWHFTIDDISVYQQLPINEHGWHAGDGPDGPGNRTTIGIEISERPGSERTAILFIAELCKTLNFTTKNITTHKNWSGKICPRVILPHWNTFVNNIELQMSLPNNISYDRWSSTYIKRAIEMGIVKGYENGNYDPTKPLTREETAVILNNMIYYINTHKK